MGTSAQKWLDDSVLTPILGIVAVCACIAIVAALIRHFLYEHNDDDTKTVSTRIMHVFGFVAVIGFLAGGGVGLSKVFEKSASLSSVNGSTGKSLLPEDLKEEKGKYDNVGDLLTEASKHKATSSTPIEAATQAATNSTTATTVAAKAASGGLAGVAISNVAKTDTSNDSGGDIAAAAATAIKTATGLDKLLP